MTALPKRPGWSISVQTHGRAMILHPQIKGCHEKLGYKSLSSNFPQKGRVPVSQALLPSSQLAEIRSGVASVRACMPIAPLILPVSARKLSAGAAVKR